MTEAPIAVIMAGKYFVVINNEAVDMRMLNVVPIPRAGPSKSSATRIQNIEPGPLTEIKNKINLKKEGFLFEYRRT